MEQEANIKHNGYSLTKEWFEFALCNPDIVSGNHTALYLWIVQVNNTTGWKEKFGLTVREGMDGMSCKSRTTYYKCFQNLLDWGFVTIVIPSKNQYQCNIITLIKNGTPNNGTPNNGQSNTNNWSSTRSSTRSSTGTILKPLNIKTDEDVKTENPSSSSLPFISISEAIKHLDLEIDDFALHAVRQTGYSLDQLKVTSEEFLKEQKAVGKKSWADVPDLRKHFINWAKKKQEITKREIPPEDQQKKARLSDSQKKQIEDARKNQTHNA